MEINNDLKRKYKQFWRNHWIKYSINDWVEALSKDVGIYHRNDNSLKKDKAVKLLTGALIKLQLEKKINKEEATNLRDMLNSPDSDNHFLALSIIRKYKPKEFKKIKNVKTA